MNKALCVTTLLLFAAVLWSGTAAGGTWYVLPDGSGAVPTIQAAVDTAVGGDSVLVATGTYTGIGNRDVDFRGKAITVVSEMGRDVTIIDCQQAGRGFVFNTGEGAASVLDGFTIQNGYANPNGAGILCDGASPTIQNCLFRWNQAVNHGGGIYCVNTANAVIEDCVFSQNRGNTGGGLAAYEGSSPEVRRCVIERNTADFVGGGVRCNADANPVIEDCTIVRNVAPEGAGVGSRNNAAPTIRRTIIAFNFDGEGVHCAVGSTTTLECCDVYGHPAGEFVGCGGSPFGTNGNFSADPQFCDLGGGNYSLGECSPCLAANRPVDSCGDIGALDGDGCMCPVPAEVRTWGEIKSRYKP